MTNKSQSFFNFDLFLSFDLIDREDPLRMFSYQEGQENTKKGRFHQGNKPDSTLSIKKLYPKLEISFEKVFLQEHKAVFRQSYHKYLESQRKQDPKLKIKPCLSQISTRTDIQQVTIDEILEDPQVKLTNDEKKQFLVDLLHQDKLSQFLTDIIKVAQPKDSLRLILLAREAWILFVPYQMRELEAADLIHLGNQFAGKQLHQSVEKLFWQEKRESKRWKDLAQFLKTLCVTLLLTIAQYFENPYYDKSNIKEGPKRSFQQSQISSLQESGEEIPAKRHKKEW